MVNKSCRKHLNHFIYATLADRTKLLVNQAAIATYGMLAWHYDGIPLLHLAKVTFLFTYFKSFAIVYVELTFVYEVGTQFKLRLIF